MCRQVARTYGGVRHRLELIRKLDGVSYINDSIATSPTRTIAGLRAMRTKPILIAGGHDKHVSFDRLADEIAERVKALYLTGDTAEQIEKARAQERVLRPVTPADLCRAGSQNRRGGGQGTLHPRRRGPAQPGVFELRPFKNFAERGDTFRKIVLEFEGNETE